MNVGSLFHFRTRINVLQLVVLHNSKKDSSVHEASTIAESRDDKTYAALPVLNFVKKLFHDF